MGHVTICYPSEVWYLHHLQTLHTVFVHGDGHGKNAEKSDSMRWAFVFHGWWHFWFTPWCTGAIPEIFDTWRRNTRKWLKTVQLPFDHENRGAANCMSPRNLFTPWLCDQILTNLSLWATKLRSWISGVALPASPSTFAKCVDRSQYICLASFVRSLIVAATAFSFNKALLPNLESGNRFALIWVQQRKRTCLMTFSGAQQNWFRNTFCFQEIELTNSKAWEQVAPAGLGSKKQNTWCCNLQQVSEKWPWYALVEFGLWKNASHRRGGPQIGRMA